MANNDPKSLLQNALSYRAKAIRLLDAATTALADGKIDQVRYDSLRDYYARHLQSAENQLAAHRADLQRSLDLLNARLETLRAEQKRLVARAAAGELKPSEANDKNRRLAKDLQADEARAKAAAALLSANRPDDVGGVIDVPLEEYGGTAGVRAGRRQQRLTTSGRRKFSWTSVAIMVVVGATILAAIFAWLISQPQPGEIAFEGAGATAENGRVQLMFKNDYPTPASLFVPWPADLSARTSESYGVMLYVRERGQREFRALPGAGDWWLQPAGGDAAIEVAPGLEVPLVLDLQRLVEGGVEADAVRVEFGRGNGEILHTFDVDVPEDLESSAPAGQRVPGRLGPVVAQPQPAPSALPVSPQMAPPPVVTTATTVKYIGGIGGKVALAVSQPDRPPQRLTVSPGDQVAEGWVLERIDAATDSVVLRRTRPDRQITIPRGQSAQLL